MDALVLPYCDYDIASQYGLKNYCEDVIKADDENIKSDLCVTEDGLPLVGNTASTRTRTRLYQVDDDAGTGNGNSGGNANGQGSISMEGNWVILAYEESKGLGGFYFQISEDGSDLIPCDDDGLPDQDQGEVSDEYECVEFDIGKNIWYHAFPMSGPEMALSLVNHGNLLNQPEIDWRTGEFYPIANTEEMWNFVGESGGDYNFEIYNTEIARRFSMIAQDVDVFTNGQGSGNGGNGDDDSSDDDSSDDIRQMAGGQVKDRENNPDDYGDSKKFSVTQMANGKQAGGSSTTPNGGQGAVGAAASENGAGNGQGQGKTEDLAAFPMWKQGIERQGGPSDTMARRIVLRNGKGGSGSQGSDAIDNPYDFANMACDEWAFEDGSNPYYPQGVCLDAAINLSAVTPTECLDLNASGEPGSEEPTVVECPSVDDDGIGDTNPDDQTLTIKTVTWMQCPGHPECETDETNLDDQSWYNPFDVSKGHRGFADEDFIMLLYAWSPTDKLNDKGKDRYELYVRRSFDGGLTWTTTPGDLGGDGTVTCETYRRADTQVGGIESDEDLEPVVCYEYDAGADEQARNVSQLKSRKWTVLDPRYAKTPASIVGSEDEDDEYIYPAYIDDERDPSRYFIIFENGDNTTTELGEPEPLDLYYSRAINYGDDYVVWADEELDPDLSECYPSDPHEDDDLRTLAKAGSGFCNEFERLNHVKVHGSEASMVGTPAGTFMYAVWNQALKEDLPMVEDDESDDDSSSDDSSADDAETAETTGATRTGVAMRRIWWIDGYIPEDAWDFGQGPVDER